LKLMNDTTATALAYGIYKQDLPETDKPEMSYLLTVVTPALRCRLAASTRASSPC